MDQKLRVGLLDFDSDVRFGRRAIIESHKLLEVVYEGAGLSEDLVGISDGLIDVLILDQRLALGSAVEFYRKLSEISGIKNAPSCIVTVAFNQPAFTLEAFEAGVLEVCSLEEGPEALLDAIKRCGKGQPAVTLSQLHELISSTAPRAELDLDLIRMVGSLPERLASNLRRLKKVFTSGDQQKLGQFDSLGLSDLVARLPVRSFSQLIVKLYKSELLNGQ